MSITDRVRSKAEEYGMEIYDDYPVNGEHVFFIEDMIIFTNDGDETIAVSFQATTRPDRAANMILIWKEMKAGVDIMDSFIFDRNNKYISGDQAFDLIDKTNQSKIIHDFVKDQTLREILISAKCHEC